MPVKAVSDTPDITAVFVFLQHAKNLSNAAFSLMATYFSAGSLSHFAS